MTTTTHVHWIHEAGSFSDAFQRDPAHMQYNKCANYTCIKYFNWPLPLVVLSLFYASMPMITLFWIFFSEDCLTKGHNGTEKHNPLSDHFSNKVYRRTHVDNYISHNISCIIFLWIMTKPKNISIYLYIFIPVFSLHNR